MYRKTHPKKKKETKNQAALIRILIDPETIIVFVEERSFEVHFVRFIGSSREFVGKSVFGDTSEPAASQAAILGHL